MSKIFGTDGIRCLVNEEPLSAETCLKISKTVAFLLKKKNSKNSRVVICKDTRLSGYLYEPLVTAGFISMGMDVILVGPLPTPAVPLMIKTLRADIGVMITASHNTYEYNGLKFFDSTGTKLSSLIEQKVEKIVLDNKKYSRISNNTFISGNARRLEDASGRYSEFLKSTLNKTSSKKKLKIVLDCANGATYNIAPNLFWELGHNIIAINNSPNGFNINKNCGSTYPNTLQRYVKKYKADLGISLDGDADRIIMCDEKGSIIDGDQIIAALAVLWKKKRILKGGVVGTLMSNYGLEDFFRRKKIKFIRANVGDRYVKEIMQKKKFNLGGEQSGHIILGKFATTGDGLLVALEVIQALNGKIKASNFFDVFEKIPQVLVNIKIKDKNILKKFSVKNSIKIANKLIKGHGRILVRKSGTEAKIRIMGESKNKVLLNKCIKNITKTIN